MSPQNRVPPRRSQGVCSGLQPVPSPSIWNVFSPCLVFLPLLRRPGGAQGAVHERWQDRPWAPLLGSSQGSLSRRSGDKLIPPRKRGTTSAISPRSPLHLGIPRCQVRAPHPACCPAAGMWGSQQSVGEGTQKSKVSCWSWSPEPSFLPALLLGLGLGHRSVRLGLRHGMK